MRASPGLVLATMALLVACHYPAAAADVVQLQEPAFDAVSEVVDKNTNALGGWRR